MMKKVSVLRTIRHPFREFCHVLVAVCVTGFLFLLTACVTELEDKDKPDSKKGPKIPVNFSVNIDAYGNDNIVESRRSNPTEPVTEMIHIANGIYLCATLEEEEPVNTRAATTATLPDGTLVRIVAYHENNTFEAECDYIVTGGELVPLTPPEMAVSPGNYRFRAYAFNTGSLPALGGAPFQTTVPFTVPGGAAEPLLDLLWGKGTVEPIPVTASSPAEIVEIKVDHLFSRIKVAASTGTITYPPVLINKVENVYVTPHYAGNATLNVVTGAMAPSSAPPLPGLKITEWREQDMIASSWDDGSNLNFTDVESNYRIVFTNDSETLSLIIGNLEVAGKPLGEYPIRFTTKLKPGFSYILKLDFKRLVWAGSNIFWDASYPDEAYHRLTFLPEYPKMEYQGFQGVYFLWGSLIGISPNGNFSASATPLYVPPIGATRPNWTTPFASSPDNSAIKPWSGATLLSIPRVTGGSLYSQDWLDNHSMRNYLSSAEAHDTINYRGDICKYLTQRGFAPPGTWRMPNAREFEPLADYSTAYIATPMYNTTQDDGMSDFYDPAFNIQSYLTKTASGYINVFPDGYSRLDNQNKDRTTRYLSGSPYYTGNSSVLNAYYSLNFSVGFLDIANNTPLGYQGLVRCVKLEEVPLPHFLDLPTVVVEDWTTGGTIGGGADGDVKLN